VRSKGSRTEFFTAFLPTPSTELRLKPFLTREQIGISVVAVVVKTGRLALTIVVNSVSMS